jgi:hypothetical protein
MAESTEILHKVRGTGAGKGDANRIGNRSAFAQNYDEIDWTPEGTVIGCECHAEKVKCAGEWLCLNPQCPYLPSYHGLVVGYNFKADPDCAVY